MCCQSVRQIMSMPEGANMAEATVEQVRCIKHFGHNSIWHAGALEDGSAIHWMGAPSSDIPVPGT